MARTTIRTEDITASEVTTAKMATDPTNADNLASGSVPAARLGNVDTSGITANQDDIALLGFKVAANGSLAKYNLIDQTIDAFEDASGVDASASTDETRDASNYYSGSGDVTVTSTGGTITTDGDYTIHKFTADGNYVTDVEQTGYELLLVGGGGAGGNNRGGGGGGGGGFNAQTGVTVTAATHAVVVGQGGAAATSWSPSSVGTPSDGTDSTFNDGATTWYGYKGGYGGYPAAGAGGSGYGSGGGEGATANGAGAANTENGSIGYAGGDLASGHITGGGGGAGAAGADGSGAVSGNGGAGATSDILVTGANVTYGGGGGGGNGDDGTAGSGGSGGGASGDGNNGFNRNASSGTDGLGGGGGGAAGRSGGGGGSGAGDGGNGVVVIRRLTTGTAYNNMTLVSNATTAVDGAPTTGDLVITYTDGAGTATINTDIKAYISRNGSAYTSAVTLVSQGTTGGHTILTANGVDLSGITTGTSMRWKIETLNQAVGKQTRIQAVSLGWS
jgi:hypothetical protein